MKDKLKLDVGCGGRGTMYDGFIGVDIHRIPKEPRKPGQKYISIDFINADLPWQEGEAEEIVCFHMIEHLSRSEGIELLKRIHTLLKPGKKAYVSCPDSKLMIEKYLAGDVEFFGKVHEKSGKPIWEGETLMDKLFFSMCDSRNYGHRTPYDIDTLFSAALDAGWEKIEELPKDHKWCKRPDHEIGLILTKKR